VSQPVSLQSACLTCLCALQADEIISGFKTMILIQKVMNLIPGLLCVHTLLLVAGSSNGVTNTRCCRSSCLRS
jgi:hypothetical protein